MDRPDTTLLTPSWERQTSDYTTWGADIVSRLNASESIAIGQSLFSPSKTAELRLQVDHNLVLYHSPSTAIWASTPRPGAVRLTMQTDGNLVMQDARGKAVWAASQAGLKPVAGSVLILQDDGNLVIVAPKLVRGARGQYVAWSTKTSGFRNRAHGSNIGDFLGNMVKTAGRPFASAVHFVDVESGKIDKAITKIPFVGPALHAVCSIMTEEYQVADAILKGQRIDRVVMAAIHREISDYKAIGPYIETVIALVPGVGPECSGAISAGLALASGQNMVEVGMAAVEGAIPGGALAKMAFDAAHGAVLAVEHHQDVGAVLIAAGTSALPIPDQAKKLLQTGLDIAKDVAQGKKLAASAAKEAIKLAPALLGPIAGDAINGILGSSNFADKIIGAAKDAIPNISPELKKQIGSAINTGIATAHAINLQAKSAVQLASPKTLGYLHDKGKQIASTDNLAKTGAALGQSFGAEANNPGYFVGLGLSRHQIGIHDAYTVRSALPESQHKAFDLAMSLHIGRATVTPDHAQALLGVNDSAGARLGFLVTRGMMRDSPDHKVAIVQTLATVPATRDGAVIAIKHVSELRSSLWARLVNWWER